MVTSDEVPVKFIMPVRVSDALPRTSVLPPQLTGSIPSICLTPSYLLWQLTQRILEAHANVATLALLEAKLNYIRSWRAQKGVGLTYFIVRFTKAKREELLAVAPNQMTRMDLTGKPLKTWRYATMKVSTSRCR